MQLMDRTFGTLRQAVSMKASPTRPISTGNLQYSRSSTCSMITFTAQPRLPLPKPSDCGMPTACD